MASRRVELSASQGVIFKERKIAREATMHLPDTMVDRPEAHDSSYAGGWIASGLMVLATIFIVYYFGF